jgi:sulfur-carrier protein adenylyltransferase/sulfurtransferase
VKRYHRQIILPEFGLEKQTLLSKAKVLVVGAGGLGAPVLQYLAAAGIGKIGIVDHDKVELSNLHRQVLFTEEDLGKPKASVSANHLRLKNSEIQILSYNESLHQNNALDIVDLYDLVIDGTDNFPTRYMINDICRLLNKPLIYGSIYKFEGQVSFFNVSDEKGNCYNYRDLFLNIPNASEVPNCSEVGVLGPIAGQIGTIMAMEAIKYFTGIGNVLAGWMLMVNSLTHQTVKIKLRKSEVNQGPKDLVSFVAFNYSEVCESNSIEMIDPEEVLGFLSNNPEIVMVDLRLPQELPKVKAYPFLSIPFEELKLKKGDFEQYQKILFFCQSGIRSLKAAQWLKDEFPNKDVYHLVGGVNLWSTIEDI